MRVYSNVNGELDFLRFRRESQEMWEKVQSENTMKELSRQNSKEEKSR